MDLFDLIRRQLGASSVCRSPPNTIELCMMQFYTVKRQRVVNNDRIDGFMGCPYINGMLTNTQTIAFGGQTKRDRWVEEAEERTNEGDSTGS